MSTLWRFSVFTILVLALPSPAYAQASIGTTSGCKALSGSARSACEKCVATQNFYQVKSKTCGLAPGMKKTRSLPVEKGPDKPKRMPKSTYVTVPAGSFAIGAKSTERGSSDKEVFESTVTITRPFLMKATEVTQAEWHFVMGAASPSYDKACGGDCAVGHVTWLQALEYLNELSKQDGLEPCYELSRAKVVWTKGLACAGYRLPTEAEWEYAARGGTRGARYGEVDDIAWHSGNSDSKPSVVGKKQPNAYGLYDMLGSQWEWAWDVEDYKPFVGKMSDPITGGLTYEPDGKSRIVRGGSYREDELSVRAGHRFQYPAGSGDVQFGFRPVRTIVNK